MKKVKDAVWNWILKETVIHVDFRSNTPVTLGWVWFWIIVTTWLSLILQFLSWAVDAAVWFFSIL